MFFIHNEMSVNIRGAFNAELGQLELEESAFTASYFPTETPGQFVDLRVFRATLFGTLTTLPAELFTIQNVRTLGNLVVAQVIFHGGKFSDRLKSDPTASVSALHTAVLRGHKVELQIEDAADPSRVTSLTLQLDYTKPAAN